MLTILNVARNLYRLIKKRLPFIHEIISNSFLYRFAARFFYRSNLKDYMRRNNDKYYSILDSLADDESRFTFIDVFKNRLTSQQNYKYKKSQDQEYFWISKLGLDIQFDKLTFVDAGSYDGKTVLEFLSFSKGKYDNIISLEPDKLNFSKVLATLNESNLTKWEVLNKGLYSSTKALRFKASHSTSSRIEGDGDVVIETISLDDYFRENKPNKLFIKMDIEGAELEALKGSEITIKKYEPIIAVCIYHSYSDLIDIPFHFIEKFPHYKLFIRHHEFNSWGTVLYAIPEKYFFQA
jgi:FkbM family methyltransferase